MAESERTISLEKQIETAKTVSVEEGCTCGGGRLVSAERPDPLKWWQLRKRPQPLARMSFVHDDSCAISVMMAAGFPPADKFRLVTIELDDSDVEDAD